jgi:hypothetical protein
VAELSSAPGTANDSSPAPATPDVRLLGAQRPTADPVVAATPGADVAAESAR